MSIFRFKQFAVDQRDCPMKINTDGVLLGAMAGLDEPTRILDIGTGTGVIALMLAQRFPLAEIIGIEIDEAATKTAKQNAENAPFAGRVSMIHTGFQTFDTDQKFDLIVSNPPFYTKSLHNPDKRRTIAKHANDTFFDQFFTFCAQHLSSDGRLNIIVPSETARELETIARQRHLYLAHRCLIASFPGNTPIRVVLRFQWNKPTIEPQETELFVIYKSKGIHSDEYKRLLSPFFLAF